MGDDASASKDEGDRGAVVTLAEHHEHVAASIGGERDTEACGDVPVSRKHATSEDTALEREAKRAWSPYLLEVSWALCPPALSVVEHADQSWGHDHSPVASGSARVREPQRGGASPGASMVPP